MNQTHPLSILLVLLVALTGNAYSDNEPANGIKHIIKSCDACHGADARVPTTVPALAGLKDSYLFEQIENFKQGKRGFDTDDPLVTEMKQQLNALNKDQLQQLAKLYSRRSLLPDPATVPGNSAQGKPLYDEHCKGCHSSTIGRFMTKSPDIANMKGPYLLAQLKLFAADKRLFSVAGKHKSKMVKVAKQFNGEELADIVAYIKSEQP
ncbi:MAG: hypothetical protein DRQ45_06935 [Gammaproteobacteria bacterium]|nr:MAG: hypothetical protein DRQ45_06935 [Gammaproteobacteria bacterium]